MQAGQRSLDAKNMCTIVLHVGLALILKDNAVTPVSIFVLGVAYFVYGTVSTETAIAIAMQTARATQHRRTVHTHTCVANKSTSSFKLRVLVAALWDKKLAFKTRERRKILDFYGRTATQGEKEIFGRAVLRFNSASEKESVLLIEDQTDL
ncbi:hypothetical protein TNCV_514461 [Trichonephila clavipes]|nr:hypothetical protein TNCV_514461 [Trichonephila clavipes]